MDLLEEEIIAPLNQRVSNKKKHPARIKAKFLLLGFDSEADEIVLDDRYRIYRGSDEELEEFYKKRNTNFKKEESSYFCEYVEEIELSGVNSQHLEYPWYILEVFFWFMHDSKVVFPYLDHFVFDKNKNDFISIGRVENTRMSGCVSDVYFLSKEDIKDFKTRWEIINEERIRSDKALKIVLSRAIYAGQKYNQEDVLIDLMIAFEAMFLKEMGELNYRLSVRVSTVLVEYYEKAWLFDFIKSSYNLRSKVVHGNEIKLKDFKFPVRDLNGGLKRTNATLKEILKTAIQHYVLGSESNSVLEFIDEIDRKVMS